MSKELYASDFYAWTQETARLLKAGQWDEVDVEHLTEEIESMGASERYQFVNRLRILLAHLLKWQFQPALRSHSWKYTIVEQRLALEDLLKDSPSLQNFLEEAILRGYRLAVVLAIKETGLDKKIFPESCPYRPEEILDETFYPAP